MHDPAIDFLIQAQLPDGSWGSGDPFICARAMTALRDQMPEETMVKGLKYLEGMQESDGHFRQRTKRYSDASNTAYTMIALNKFDYGKASLPISRGILWLLENQNEDGSWGPNKSKKAFTTTFCLRALHTFYLSGLQRFARGLDFSREYMGGLHFESEPVSHVYAPVLNLQRIGYLDDVLKEKFVEYALDASSTAIDAGNVTDAAYLLGTLKALDEQVISPIIEDWLDALRSDDGGFGAAPGEPGVAGTTALVLLAMSNTL